MAAPPFYKFESEIQRQQTVASVSASCPEPVQHPAEQAAAGPVVRHIAGIEQIGLADYRAVQRKEQPTGKWFRLIGASTRSGSSTRALTSSPSVSG